MPFVLAPESMATCFFPYFFLPCKRPDQFNKGSDLTRDCKAWLALTDESRELKEDEVYGAGACQGYIDGLTAGLISMRSSCPEGATLGTLIRVYLVFIDKHPQLLDASANAGFFGAMKESYPCSDAGK